LIEGAKHGGPEYQSAEVQEVVAKFLDQHLKGAK
jgi:hypothetical protein